MGGGDFAKLFEKAAVWIFVMVLVGVALLVGAIALAVYLISRLVG